MSTNLNTFILPVRIVQGVFTIIILGLTAYVVNSWSTPTNWYTYPHSPSQANFLLFCSIWTIPILAYLILAPTRFPAAAHKYGILAAEAVTMIFWFAGFVALASLLGDVGCARYWSVCRASEAAVVFGAFEWLLFTGTTILAALHVSRSRKMGNTAHDPAVEVQPAV
ncbi:hypothetical protein LSUB1_G008375 [Lachnellula subtilissima]|uniref:MARVEL domain-containing protein n=1 Tax=Lachnellula subtilissima TaxID=602034 RepID=A0A8H8RCY8_9HELO|nr:hypothetical protein LSUB1_G008375 [Lachnellula subtilissima]